MLERTCAYCLQPFLVRPQVPQQAFCSATECQRFRRSQWLKQRLRDDPDYRDNRARSQRAWLDRNPDYWRRYRAARSLKDTSLGDPPSADDPMRELMRGIYVLRIVGLPKSAKTDAWIVELSPLREDSVQSQRLQR